ncbi:MTAP family purine nucleoside phosphorylase [bacterium]|nr:MTAP family purine nucleoside phosphorylase [bacterium]
MMETVGIIGGSGLYELSGFELVEKHHLSTPFGAPSGPIVELSYQDAPVFFLPRHGEHHEFLPHELPYRANIFALKSLGVTSCLSISAVGSLREEVAPGDFLFPDQLIDWTLRKNVSFLEKGFSGYPASADPFSDGLSEELATVLTSQLGEGEGKVHRGGSYICIEGPHLSTRAESAIYRSFGASLIGMTACPEVKLAFEAQMKFSLLGMVSDYDCWHVGEEDVSVAQVLAVISRSSELVKRALPSLIEKMRTVPRSEEEKSQLRGALMGDPESGAHQELARVLLS